MFRIAPGDKVHPGPAIRPFIFAQVLVLASLMVSTVDTSGQQLTPYARVFGSITINGANAPGGAVVAAYSGPTLCGIAQGNGLYNASTSVYYVDLASSQTACSTPGNTISFKINGQAANETVAVPAIRDSAVQLNLTVSVAAPPPPAPVPPPPPSAGGGQPGSVSISFPPGWQLVGGPTGSHLSGAVGRLFTFQAGDSNYESFAVDMSLQVCVGYWAYFPVGGSITLPTQSGQSSCVFVLADGQWAMVGSPQTIGPSAIIGASRSLNFRYGAYGSTSSIAAGTGVWVKGPGTVTVIAPGLLPPSPPMLVP